MPVLSQRLGELHRQPVYLQVVPVRVGGEQLRGVVADRLPDRDELQADQVPTGGGRAEEVGDA